MESLSRPPHRRKHSSSTNASSSSFSLKNPYDDVLLSRSGKAKFEPREYAEIFAGSSSIPVLDLSGLNEPRGCRSSDLDYSNIFGGARDADVAVPYDQLFNGAVKKTKTRMAAEAEQQNGSVNSLGKAKRSLGANGVSADGTKQQLNMSFNKINQRSSNESNGKTHIAQLHAVPGFTHFVDGTSQLQKKDGDKPVLPLKREVSRTWSFQAGIDATMVNAGLSSEQSHVLDKPCNVNGVNLKSHISKVQPHSDRPTGSNDNNDIEQSGLPSFASKETSGENSPPLFDEELDENSDAAVSIAALKKAIEQAQEIIRIAKMIMQKRREGTKDGSRARRSKGRSEVEDKKGKKTERPSGCMKENNVMEINQRLDPNFPMFTGVSGKSAPTLRHSDKFVNAQSSKETVRENFEAANDHRDAFIEVEKKFVPSCSQSESLNTDKKVEVGNIGQNAGDSKPLGERANFTGTVETVVLESVKVECNNKLICSRTKGVPCLEHMETNQESLEQREPTMHQPEEPAVISRGEESVANTSQSALELEQRPNEDAVEQCQVTVSPTKRLAVLAEQLERFLSVPLSMQEQERVTHGGGDLRISQENDQKFVGHEEFYVAEYSRMPRSDFNTSKNESLSLANKNTVNQADTDNQPENVFEWKAYGQDEERSKEDENLMVPKEEILWFESELQLEEPVEEQRTEREPEIFHGVGEAATKVDTALEPEIDDEKLNVELENDSQTVRGEHGESKSASICEAVEITQIRTYNDSEVEDNGISSGVEELNGADREAGKTKKLEDKVEELNDSASEKDSSEAFAVHSNDPPGTIFRENHGITRTILSETPEPCNVNFNEAEKYQSVPGGCEENIDLPRETEIFMAVEDNVTGKKLDPEINKMPGTDSLSRCASSEKFTVSQLNNTFEGLSLDSESPSVVFVDSDHEKILPDDEDIIRRTTEIHNTAEEYAAKTNMQNWPEGPELHAKPELQQISENSEESQTSSTLDSIDEASVHESPVRLDDAKDISSEKEEVKGDRDDQRVHAGNSVDQSHLSQSNCEPKEKGKSVEAESDVRMGQNVENNTKNSSKTSTSEQQNAKGNEQKYEVDDHLQRIEAIKRGREREKDRIAVDIVIREARERAFVEARERAERAAAERAAAEARQRVMGEVREKTVKAPIETKPSADKASTEAKLRAQRAAVERATTEARERALEKAMSQKTSMGTGARVQGAKYSAERSASSSMNNGLKHSFSSSDMDKSDGATSESAQRRKARLERHQRIMERAAKALAEKNMRDLLAQKEQAERSRLAESLDADIKRWATGKQGNLRALLSTLQYILGPDSGWQPLSLTEIVTTAAVKKAYRKATLCVHPDKLQQRGANIQQKYICEKIFDLLKAAWNRFNSEEN